MAMPYNSLKSKAGFFTFVSLLACLTSTTVICFSMAILDDAFIYAGIACLIAVVLLAAGYAGCRYSCTDPSPSSDTSPNSTSPTAQTDADGQRRTEYRRLEREVEELLAEVRELQVVALCSAEALDRENENIHKEYRQLKLWIGGSKIPEATEVQELMQRLDTIAASLQNIRRRSERITSSLAMRPMASVNLNLVIHEAIHPSIPRPPPYEDSRRGSRPYSAAGYAPFTISHSYLTPPSYCSMSRVSLAAPSDDLEAPPPYDDAIGTAV